MAIPLRTLSAGARQGVRRLMSGDTSAMLMVVCLSIGLAVNATAFTVFSAVLLRPLQYPEEDRLVLVFERHPKRGVMAVTPGNFVEWQKRSRSFERATAFLDSDFTLTVASEPTRVRGQEVIRDFFEVYGVAALFGSVFQPEHYTTGAKQVTVLSYGLWQEAFGGDPAVVGRTVEIDYRPYRIVGVMPRAFELGNIDLWIPWVPEPEMWSERRFHYFPTLARLKRGVELQQAQAESSAIYAALEAQSPQTNAQWRPELEPLREFVFGESLRNTAAVLQASVLLVLAVVCINSMFLMAARELERRRESMVRVALGATRLHRAAERLGEAVAISTIAVSLGIAAGYWLVRFIAPYALPTDVPVAFDIELDFRTLAFIAGLAFIVTVCLAAPALFRPWECDESAGSRLGRGLTHQRSTSRRQLLLVQVAFTTLLVAVATVMTRVEASVEDSSVGFEPEQLLVSDIVVPEARYETPSQLAAFERTLIERIMSVPGVIGAASTSYVPLTPPTSNWRFAVVGMPPLDSADDCSARPIIVSRDFFRLLRVPIRSGRVFTDADRLGGEGVAVVNGVAARNCWRSRDPVGTRIEVNGIPAPFTIIGTVGDIATGELAVPPEATIYLTQEQEPRREISVIVRAAAKPLDLTSSIRQAVRSIDRTIPIGPARTFDQIRAELWARPRFRRSVMLVFAVMAIALSALGLYATSMHAVLNRAHELGVRSALGAEPRRLTRLLLSEWTVYVPAGVLLGSMVAAWLTRILQSVKVGVEPAGFDVLSIAGVVVCAASLAATYWPIRRYGQADAASLLRAP